MATTTTTTFAPDLGGLVIASFRRCGIHRTELTSIHMQDARTEANLLMADWVADGINLWQVEIGSMALSKGVDSYDLPSNLIFMLDVYIRTGDPSAPTDRLIYPMSRSDYASLANKSSEGFTTSYWFQRKMTPRVSLWMVPDQDSYYTFYYYYMRQAYDSELSNAAQMDVPWYYLDAFVSGLARNLSVIYAPDRYQMLVAQAQRSWERSLSVGTENTPITIYPQMRGYYR